MASRKGCCNRWEDNPIKKIRSGKNVVAPKEGTPLPVLPPLMEYLLWGQAPVVSVPTFDRGEGVPEVPMVSDLS